MEIADQHVFSTRNAEICRLYLEGNTLADVGERFGISRQRVKQILKRGGVWRPRVIEREAFLGVNVSEETKEGLKQEAERQGISMSRLASNTLDDLVEESNILAEDVPHE